MSANIDIEHEEPAPDAGVWLPIAELAELKGKARQTVWEKVTRLEADGLLTTRQGPGGTRLVNVAEYDRVLGETTDFIKQQAALTRSLAEGSGSSDPTFFEAQRLKMKYEADLKGMEVALRRRELVRADDLRDAVDYTASAIVRLIDAIVQQADDVAAAVQKNGIRGAQQILKSVAYELKKRIADECQVIADRSIGSEGNLPK